MAQHDALTDRRIWLAVPHEEKDMALQRGGKRENGQNNVHWDKEAKLWYADPGTPQANISPWLPDTTARATGAADPREEFGQALQAAGLVLDGLPVMDGKVHRVATLEDKKGKKTGGAYKGFNDRRPGGWFVNYHRAANEKEVTNWKATGGETDALTTLHIRAGARQAADDSERARELMYAENAQKAHGLYTRLDAATSAHPYLQAKGVSVDPALRLTNNNALVIPFSNVDGEFRSLQYITPQGDKSLFKEAPKAGNFFVTGGALENGAPVLYAEGYATARSLHMATGLPVVMTVDAGNMRTVAEILGERYPDSPHVFMADLDHAKQDNKGLLMAQDAAARVPNGAVLTPDFNDAEKAKGLTDFNDLHQSRGLEALSDKLARDLARHAASQPNSSPEDTMSNASEHDADKPQQAAPENVTPTPAQSDPQPAAQENATPTPAQPVQAEAEPEPDTAQPAPPHAAPEKRAQAGPAAGAAQDEDGFAFGPRVPGGADGPQPAATSTLIDTDRLLQRVTWNEQKGSVQYLVDQVPAFRDHGNRMTMESPESSKDPEHVMAALLTAVRHYGGKLEITGSDEFKQRAIDLIASHGLKVTMKNPAQQAMLDDARRHHQAENVARDAVHASPVTPADLANRAEHDDRATQGNGPTAPSTGAGDGHAPPRDSGQNAPGTTEQAPRAADKETLDFKQGVKGQIVEHGPAPYDFDKKNAESYFIKLRTKSGVKTVWGVELESAMRQSRVGEGQVVNLQLMGKNAVNIQKPVHDEQGKLLRYEAATVHRNTWQITPLVAANVRPHDAPNLGETLSAYDLRAFETLQSKLSLKNMTEQLPDVPSTADRLLWVRGDGRGTTERGDALTAQRPRVDANAGKPVLTSWTEDGRVALTLVKGHGPFLQGVALINDRYHHVLASLPGKNEGPNLIINAVTAEGLKYVGYGRAINKVEGKPVQRDALVFKLAGDPPDTTRIAKLDRPDQVPPQVHAALGFDERFRFDADHPKSTPRADNHHKAQPGTGRPG
ncbi:hypothetical protein ASE93_23610 [Serratia sp. Leaf50]|nr:hypothetical protein ASE93_23610 [Serratia sp. Leaf50]